MKRITLLSFILLLCVGSNAQVRFGMFSGPQLNSSKYSINGEKQHNDAKIGFQFGGTIKVPFDEQLYFAPAAYYSLKGYKVTLTQPAFPPDTNAIDNNTTIHTFELAALLQFDFSPKPTHFFLKAGPSIDFQLAGKEKFHTDDNTTVDRSMRFGFADYGHYAASLVLQLGYEGKAGFFVFGQYTHGVGSINNADYGPRIRHRVVGISFGKYFGGRKI